MKPLLVATHGWMFGPGVWRPLMLALPEYDFELVDLGFSGRARQFIAPTDRPWIAMGHSLGFLWHLMSEQRQNMVAMVAINGFYRFPRGRGYPMGVPPRVLQMMEEKLDHDPAAIINDFRKMAGWREQSGDGLGGLVPERLQEGLNWLQNWDGLSRLQDINVPLLILASRDDLVVPPAMTQALIDAAPAAKCHWQEDGGHLFPLTKTAWCAKQIRQFL